MRLFHSTFALTFSCLFLISACSSEVSDDDAKRPTAEMDENSTIPSEQAKNVSSESVSAPLTFDKPTLDENDLEQLTLFGVKIGMTPEEVNAAITSRDFKKPKPTEGQAFVRYSPFAIECNDDAENDPCQTVGFIQAGALEWTRGENDEEKLIPLFYIDRDLNQKLYAMDYKRAYDPAIDPENIAKDMVERYGTPSDTSDFRGKHLWYHVQMPMPAGFVPESQDTRGPHQTASQRQVMEKIGRASCRERV